MTLPNATKLDTPIPKLVIIGLGLIGGSLAAAVKQRQLNWTVIGVVRRRETVAYALSKGIVDRCVFSLEDVAAQLGEGDIIVIAVPTLSVPGIMEQISQMVDPRVIITDGASVKGSVVAAAEQAFGQLPRQFVPGHPIAGSEKSGVTACNADLYVRHRVILTPLDVTLQEPLRRVTDLWQSVGAEVLTLSVEQHDAVLALTSHLPHAIAYSLVDTLLNNGDSDNILRYAAGGFRDFTRIAGSDPVMWRDIMCANREAILKGIDLFQNNLSSLRQAVADEDSDRLLDIFSRVKVARDEFSVYHATQPSATNPAILRYTVQPGGRLSGSLRVPGDKSISHRAIMLGAIAEGITEVTGFLEGEDAMATLRAFKAMGVPIEGPDNGAVRIHGVGRHGLSAPAGPLNLGNAGTAMRLLAGLLAGQSFTSTLTGDQSLCKRPMERVARPLRAMGIPVDTQAEGRPPITIHGGNPQALDYAMPMASAQVKSCVLLAGLYAHGETSIVEPAPTRDHTERMLRGFGYAVTTDGRRISLVGGGQLQAASIDIPADISSAAFFMVAATIAPGSDITLEHVGINPTRDGVITILRLMGADIQLLNRRTVGGEPVADIRVRHAPLTGIPIPPDLVPLAIDEFPALFIAAACAEGRTVLTGAEELRVKESDRIQVMVAGLRTLGVDAEATPDGVIIEGGQLRGGAVETHDDHRVAMSFTVAALRAAGAVVINNCGHVATSFPGFVELARRAGISIEQEVV